MGFSHLKEKVMFNGQSIFSRVSLDVRCSNCGRDRTIKVHPLDAEQILALPDEKKCCLVCGATGTVTVEECDI